MHGDIVNLNEYRKLKRKLYLERYEGQLNAFIDGFVGQHFACSFDLLREQYLQHKASQNELSWDYQDFRETLKAGVFEAFGDQIWAEIKQTYWFDPVWLSKDEVVEKLVSHFVLGTTIAANE